jgi:hypothetical protein
MQFGLTMTLPARRPGQLKATEVDTVDDEINKL